MLLGYFLIILLITSCGNSLSDSTRDQSIGSSLQSSVGTNGELIPIESNNVRAAGYDEESLVMSVQFNNGSIYEYYEVPTELWSSFFAAQPHPWSKVGYSQLVQGGYKYKRVQ